MGERQSCGMRVVDKDLLLRYTNEDEQTKRFEMYNVNCSFSHLETIKIDNFCGSLIENKYVLQLVKYLLKHATVLEEFVIATATLQDTSPDYDKLIQEVLSFPISSSHSSYDFRY
ncbi:hypothetical protein HAX54_041378 [Datura stramonium]|uniref:FBD domain-containing protein n=1 Tax=Datura stramonium TaxID=4076 RepID=A0ABS8VUF4_DATST|nr:hypothetical protein [Datura stramonium]